MVELAKQAFLTNNFDLAADVYERLISENGPRAKLYIGLADSYALSGQIKKAFDAYIKAYRLDRFKPDSLSNLVTALVNNMNIGDGINEKEEQTSQPQNVDPFICASCKSLFCDPVTVKCGHTFCQRCLKKQQVKECKVCGVVSKHSKHFRDLKVNVLLSKTVEDWFPNECKAGRLKEMGNQHFEDCKYEEAIKAYTEALEYVPADHLIASNRSYAHSNLQHYKEALSDAEYCISLKPDWSKGYFRKATALTGLNNYEEAAFCYLQCLSLDSSAKTARTRLANTIHKMLAPVSLQQQPKHTALQSTAAAAAASQNPLIGALKGGSYPNDIKSNPGEYPGQTSDGDNTLVQLRDSIRKSLGKETVDSERSSGIPVYNRPGSSSSSSPSQTLQLPAATMRTISKSCSDPCLVKAVERDDKGRRLSSLMSQLLKTGSRKRGSDESHSNLSSESSASTSSLNKIPKGCDFTKRHVAQGKLNKEDFECSLCTELLFQPVTTPCGHSFCRECLSRCLDYSANCPLCKSSLVEHLAERRSSVTESIEQILQIYFIDDYCKRKQKHEEELKAMANSDAQYKKLPLFVCTLAYPKVACPLHVFEPRYRLMVRQCMESGTRQFGMVSCFDDNEANHVEYGTTLEIRDVQYFPDGRSVLDCVGGKRFKIIERGMQDGYRTGKVKFLEDTVIPPQEMAEVQTLHDEVYQKASKWLQAIPANLKQKILANLGHFPPVEANSITLVNGPIWHWWILAALPLDQKGQLAILAMSSLKDRLKALDRVLTFVLSRHS